MPLLSEYAVTPDVFDVASYSTEDECSARIEVIREALLTEGLVRDLRSGSWSSLFNPGGRRHAPAQPSRRETDRPSRRAWHPRGARLVKKLSTEQRLVKWRPMRPEPPADDAGWCAEALATHAKAPLTGGVIVTKGVKDNFPAKAIVARIDRLSSAPWWKGMQSSSVRLGRTTAEYEIHLDPVLRCSNSLMFIDPHLDPTEPRYAGFARLLQRAGSRIPAPLVEIHRRVPPDRKFEGRFRDALMAPLRSAGLHARVFMWATGTRFHDRYLISNLVGILLPDGFDTGKGRTTWTRLGSDDRDDIQREFDQGSRRHRLVRSFDLP